VGQGARLTRILATASWIAAGVVCAQPPTWIVEGSCRDGHPHGRYELRTGSGALRVAGAFNHGKRTSSFIFWSARGSRIAHIPYDEDQRNGTLALWYATPVAGVEPPRRFESVWRRGERDGTTRSWYRDGHRRSETEYERGRQVTSVGWTDAGGRLPDTAARDIASRDAVAADAHYAELEALVLAHLPRCD
jgi:hypothetical protein